MRVGRSERDLRRCQSREARYVTPPFPSVAAPSGYAAPKDLPHDHPPLETTLEIIEDAADAPAPRRKCTTPETRCGTRSRMWVQREQVGRRHRCADAAKRRRSDLDDDTPLVPRRRGKEQGVAEQGQRTRVRAASWVRNGAEREGRRSPARPDPTAPLPRRSSN